MAGKRNTNPKGSPQNLTPFNKMDADKKREIQSKGGKVSGQKYRERKAFKEAILDALKTTTDDGKTTFQDLGIEALMIKYASGDLKAFELVRDTVGEKPTDKQEVKVVETDWFV